MGLMDFIRGELIEILEFNDDSRDTISWRFPDSDREILMPSDLPIGSGRLVEQEGSDREATWTNA